METPICSLECRKIGCQQILGCCVLNALCQFLCRADDLLSKGSARTAWDCMIFAVLPSPSRLQANSFSGTLNRAVTAGISNSGLASFRFRPLGRLDFSLCLGGKLFKRCAIIQFLDHGSGPLGQ